MNQYSHLVFANHEVTVHPRVVLLKNLCAILALSQKNFLTTWMYFRILGYVVNATFVNCPAVVLRRVLCHLFRCISNRIWVFNKWFFVVGFSKESLTRISTVQYLRLMICRLLQGPLLWRVPSLGLMCPGTCAALLVLWS